MPVAADGDAPQTKLTIEAPCPLHGGAWVVLRRRYEDGTPSGEIHLRRSELSDLIRDLQSIRNL